MSVARVLVKQNDAIFRLLKFEARPDGSLLVFLDRDPSPLRGAMSLSKEGAFVPSEAASTNKITPHAKISCHTTGEIHYYSAGSRRNTFYIEPLPQLSKSTFIAFFSIPQLSKLDRFEERQHRHDVAATLDAPDDVNERITFVLELAPREPVALESYGVSLNYEVYSAVVRLVPNPSVGIGMIDHFIHGVPTAGEYASRVLDKARAELSFHHRAHGEGVLVFRENGGAYVLLTAVPMRIAPKLTITFDRSDLFVEVIPFDQVQAPTHKVRFWICDRGGKNKRTDLRKHIVSIELNSEL